MTPAIRFVKKKKITHKIHQYQHDSTNTAYGLEAAEKLQVEQTRVFKTLLVCLDNKELVVAVIPVSSMLSMKSIAKIFSAKKAIMADKSDVERATGYVLGGVSPLGQKKHLKTVIDVSANNHQTIFVSAGRRGMDIELMSNDLKEACAAVFSEISQ